MALGSRLKRQALGAQHADGSRHLDRGRLLSSLASRLRRAGKKEAEPDCSSAPPPSREMCRLPSRPGEGCTGRYGTTGGGTTITLKTKASVASCGGALHLPCKDDHPPVSVCANLEDVHQGVNQRDAERLMILPVPITIATKAVF